MTLNCAGVTARVARNVNIRVALGFDFEGEKMPAHRWRRRRINLNLQRCASSAPPTRASLRRMMRRPCHTFLSTSTHRRRWRAPARHSPRRHAVRGKDTLSRILNGKDTDAHLRGGGKPLAEIIPERSVQEFQKLEAEVSSVLRRVTFLRPVVLSSPLFADCPTRAWSSGLMRTSKTPASPW